MVGLGGRGQPACINHTAVKGRKEDPLHLPSKTHHSGRKCRFQKEIFRPPLLRYHQAGFAARRGRTPCLGSGMAEKTSSQLCQV